MLCLCFGSAQNLKMVCTSYCCSAVRVVLPTLDILARLLAKVSSTLTTNCCCCCCFLALNRKQKCSSQPKMDAIARCSLVLMCAGRQHQQMAMSAAITFAGVQKTSNHQHGAAKNKQNLRSVHASNVQILL